VQLTDLTISSSVCPMSHRPSRHLPSGTTPSAVSTRALLVSQLQSTWRVPATPVLITYATPVSRVRYLQCTCNMPAYRYLIIHFPDGMRVTFCEVEVYIRRKFLAHTAYVSCRMYRVRVVRKEQMWSDRRARWGLP